MIQKIRIAHLSDPHFGTVDREKKIALHDRLVALSPDWIVISGDVTQRARRQQFVEARAFCETLAPSDVMIVPGNHDIPLFNVVERVAHPYHGFTRHLGFPVHDRRKRGPFEVITCNSTDRFRHIQGELSDEELLRLESYSDDSSIRIAVFHQPLDCPKPEDEKNLLKFTDESVPVMQKSRVDLTLSGHIHDPLAVVSSGRYPQGRKFVISVAGTCLSSRVRSFAPNSFHLIEIELAEKTTMAIARYDLLQGEFNVRSVTGFERLQSGDWSLTT